MRTALIALSATACFSPPDLNLVDAIPLVGNDACAASRVVRVGCVIDGDTFDIDGCGEPAERVRLLGIDAPEIAHAPNPADCWGDEAHHELQRLIEGREVALSFDKECTGVYGRSLAYIWLSADSTSLDPNEIIDGTSDVVLINEALVSAGYARLYDETWVADLRLQAQMDAAQASAMARGVGLWSICDP